LSIPISITNFLQEPYAITEEQIALYRERRCIKLSGVLNAETLQYFHGVLEEVIATRNTVTQSLEQRDTYGKAFLQLMNLWREDDRIKALVFSKRIAGIATALMETTGVRLYHDQALCKEPGGGITPWHADQYYWPLDSDKTITAWMPLQATPLEMGPLEFCAGSHRIQEGRELAISDESEEKIGERLRVTDYPQIREPFASGDISFHSGWVFHRAGANQTNEMRQVMTVIYMDKAMRLKQPENKNQQLDWEVWCPGAVVGEEIDTPLNPVLYAE
jgi:ectoine hydroxylase-related dioxygenase (phytanoyl-CoA dioxygenase family)